MVDRRNQVKPNYNHNRLLFFFGLIALTVSIESCSSKPEPLPVAKAKPKKPKPDWIVEKKMDIDYWYGIGSVAIGDSLNPKAIARKSIQSQVYNQIKKNIKNEIDISNTDLDIISNEAITSRVGIIKDLTKEKDSYNDGIRKYTLLSLNKNEYSAFLQNRFEGYSIEKVLGRIKGPPGKENFLLLAKAIRMIVGSIDYVVKKDQQPKSSKNKILNQVGDILNDYNGRIDFVFDPIFLSSIPIVNDNKNITIGLVDKVSKQKLDSIDVYLDYGGKYDKGFWLSDSDRDHSLLLPASISRSSYLLSIGINYERIFGGNYLGLFSIKPNNYEITVIPQNVTIYSTESISTLGTGLEYSAVYDSIKSCFGDNYGAEFVQNINEADLLMNIEVSTNENMRRESRKQPFKSEAFFIVSLEYRESGDALISHAIAKSEALDYDFVERASIKALRELANKSIHVICQ